MSLILLRMVSLNADSLFKLLITGISFVEILKLEDLAGKIKYYKRT